MSNATIQFRHRAFLITNAISGQSLGVYKAATECEALDLMAQDCGYADWAAAQQVAVSQEGELIVSEVNN